MAGRLATDSHRYGFPGDDGPPAVGSRCRCASRNRRRAFTLVEMEAAFVLLGLGLAGLLATLVTSSRQLGAVEDQYPQSQPFYLSAPASTWARRLGATAAISHEPPVPGAPQGGTPARRVSVRTWRQEPASGLVELTVEAEDP